MANPAPKTRGSHLEAFTGNAENVENFWTALESYYWLNRDVYTDENKRISAALTHFKVGTPAGEWARKTQKKALAQNPVDFGTWARFKTNFDKHFVPADSEIEAANAMHSKKMGTRPFNEWYQEWSVHASRSGVDNKTKMYAFRNNLPEALHNKLLGLEPQPTTLDGLVEKTHAFDCAYHAYRANRPSNNSGRSTARTRNTRAVTAEESSSSQINYTNLEAVEGKITQAEKEQHFKEKLCFYCGKANHQAKDCRSKKPFKGKFTPHRNIKARATTVQEKTLNEEHPSPPYDRGLQISSIYSLCNCFDILRPQSAPLNKASINDEDF
jgi:Retrotransposon gag protein/Zinc knuckle